MNAIREAFVDGGDPPVDLTYGVVTQASPLLVTVGASTTAVSLRKLTSYTPTLGDMVLVLVKGPDRVVLGKLN